MNKPFHFSISLAALLLLPLLLSLTGCATPQTSSSRNNHLQNYRKVYFVSTEEDPRKACPKVLARLKETGFDVTTVNSNRFSVPVTGNGFVITPKGRLIVHEGAGPGAELEPPSLVCLLGYVSVFDPEWGQNGFQTIRLYFFDMKTGDVVYKASKFEYIPTVPEDAELNRLFIKISDDFFPGGPNPFKGKKPTSSRG